MNIKMRSIKTKYLFAGISICLVSLLLVSVTTYVISYNLTAQQLNMRIQSTGMKNAAELDLWFQKYGQITEDLAANIESTGIYESGHLFKLLKARTANYGAEVSEFYIGFADKRLISVSSWVQPDDYDCRTRNWYIQAVNHNDSVIYTKPYLDAKTGNLVITIARAMKKEDKIIGVLAADIFLNHVLDVVGNYSLGEGSYAFLLDQGGNVLAHPKREFLPDIHGLKHIGAVGGIDYSRLVQTMNSDKLEIIEMKDYDEESKYFILSKIKSCGWILGITVMKSEYQKPLNSLFYGFMAALVLSLLAGIIIMLKLVSGMIRPIQSLSDTVKKFSATNMTVRAKIDTDDEIGALGSNFNQMADTIQEYSQSLELKVAVRTRELQEKNNNIMESINYAERLQRASLPQLPQRMGLSAEKCFVVWRPKDVVGGDMYWCRGDERQTLLAVVDCTGHGVPGALMSMTVGSILDGLPRELEDQKPAMLLHAIHVRLKETLGQDNTDSQVNDGADIALCLIDRNKKRLKFAGAKLSLFVATDGEITEYKGVRHSVGYAWRKEVDFSDCEVEWRPDSTFYISTDGLLDQNCEEGLGGMGRTVFVNFLRTIAGMPLIRQKQAVEGLIAEMLAKVEQRDDITVIGFEL
ncbi:MAG: cache domain-containing protein [Negativicutes bacterium]